MKFIALCSSEAISSSDIQGISCILWKNKCSVPWSAFVLIPSHINPIHPFPSNRSSQPQVMSHIFPIMFSSSSAQYLPQTPLWQRL